MFSFSTCRLVLLVSAACSAMTSAEPTVELLAVELGDAGNYAIIAKTGISTVPSSNIYGDIAVSPIAATAMTGFSLMFDSSGEFSESAQLFGHAFSASDAEPTPKILTAAVGDMETAYTDAAGRLNTDADRINVGAGTLGGVYGGPEDQLTPGVYTFGSNVNLNGNVHFSGDGVYIIQITGNLVQAADYGVILEDGAKPWKIFWQVAGFVEVGAGSTMQGIILAKTKVDFITGSSLIGRVLAQTACNLQMATITEPETEPIARSYDLESFFYLEFEATDGGYPTELEISDALNLFIDSYNQLLETEYDDPFDRKMDTATVISITPVGRRLDHPQQESRQLQYLKYLLFLRIRGSCRGCGWHFFFTNQVNRRRKLDVHPGVPTEPELLAACSCLLSSSSGSGLDEFK
jgi:hypothetical protein